MKHSYSYPMFTVMKKLLLVAMMVFFAATAYAQSAPPAGLEGQSLKDWLKANYYDGNHNTLGYTTARMYMYNYIDNQNNTLTGVYSGYEVSWAYGGTGTNPAPINCEHTVPQSFFGSVEPMKSDIHHLFPTYQNWNSTRSNHPFADIDDNTTVKWMYLTSEQTSIPTNNIDGYSEYANSQFEPREVHKGNVARAIFYFYTMYPSQAGDISAVADPNTLYQWHLADPVDGEEIARNNMIEAYQGDRNPYIDYPEAVAAAWGFGTVTPPSNNTPPLSPSAFALQSTTTTIDLTWSDVSNESGYYLYKSVNNGNFSQIATLQANASSYTDTNVAMGTSYSYYLVAYNAYGNSPQSAIASGALQNTGGEATASDLFISEYIEGSSYNKAIEIANFTGAAVNLANYALAKQSNGAGSWTTLSLSGTLANGEVYVIAYSTADATILATTDLATTSGVMTFNGNDAVSLQKNGTVIDVVGDFNSAAVFGQDVTLVRNATVNAPSNTYSVAEWTSYPSNTFTYIGAHTINGGGTTPTPDPCDQATNLTSGNISDAVATLSWTAGTGATSYNIRYRATGTANWAAATTSNMTISVSGLLEATTYEFQVATVCASATSDYTTSSTFTTLATPCGQATNLTASNITQTGATLSWNATAGVIAYNVRYREAGTATWTNNTLSATSIALTGLTAGTAYEFQVATTCANSTGNFTASVGFTTDSAPVVVEPLNYCNSYGQSTADEWLQSVSFAGISNVSGNNGGYADFTAQTANVSAGSSYGISMSPAWSGRTYNEAFDVWIDFNQDGVFDDATELVFTAVRSKLTTVSGSVYIPTTAKTGNTRMRVSMKYNRNATPCEVFSYGEVEDYTIAISGGATARATKPSPVVRTEMPIDLTVFPNPASTIANISMEVPAAEGDVQVVIVGMDGRQVFANTYGSSDRVLDISVDVSNYPTGFYIVKVATAQSQGTFKIIVK